MRAGLPDHKVGECGGGRTGRRSKRFPRPKLADGQLNRTLASTLLRVEPVFISCVNPLLRVAAFDCFILTSPAASGPVRKPNSANWDRAAFLLARGCGKGNPPRGADGRLSMLGGGQ